MFFPNSYPLKKTMWLPKPVSGSVVHVTNCQINIQFNPVGINFGYHATAMQINGQCHLILDGRAR